MRALVILAALAGAAEAQIVNARVTGVTHIQATLAYEASSDDPCAVEVSASPGFTPLAHDVNPALFAGADLDSRQPGLQEGRLRTFVVGQRRVDKASDGKLYSRALEVFTRHYYRIRCGTDEATGQFMTANLPNGDTFPESPPFHADGYGNYGWPTIDWEDRSKMYIDPMTGVALKRLTAARDFGGTARDRLFHADGYFDAAGAWTNPQNARSGTTATLASVSTANAPLFLGIDPSAPRVNRMLDLGVRVFGSGTDAVAANREIAICLTIDSGQSCFGQTVMFTLPEGAAAQGALIPASFPAAGFQGWGKTVPMVDIAPTTGSVAAAAGVVTYTGGGRFRPGWTAGTKIRISGSDPTCPHNLCTIASVQSAEQVTLVENLTLATANWGSADFGIRVAKTTGMGTVSVSFNHDYVFAEWMRVTDRGNDDRCSRVPAPASVDAQGNPMASPAQGYLCSLTQENGGAAIYWIGEDGDVRPISVLRFPPVIPGAPAADQVSGAAAYPGGQYVTFDTTQPNVLYVALQTSGGKTSIYKVTYTGDYRAWSLDWSANPGGDIPFPLPEPDNMQWENIMPPSQSRDVQAQIDQFYPAYDKTRLGEIHSSNFFGGSGKYALFARLFGFGDSVCHVMLFDLTTGIFERGFNSYDGAQIPELRWGGCHSVGVGGPPDSFYFSYSTLAIGGNYGGPYQSAVTAVRKNNAWSANTSLPASADGTYDAACPTDLDTKWQQQGATGNNCATVRVAAEPCSANAQALERSWTPCPTDPNKGFLQPIAEGDIIFDPNAVFPPDSERMRVVRKTPVGVDGIELVLQRFAFARCGPLTGQRQHNNGWLLTMNITGCQTNLAFFVPGQWFRVSNPDFNGHFDYGVGDRDGEFREVVVNKSRRSGAADSVGLPPEYTLSFTPGFARAAGLTGGLQSYPSGRQWNAPAAERVWILDFHHTEFIGFQTTTLQPGTSSVYRINIQGQNVDPKRLPLVVYAGWNLLRDESSPMMGDTLTDADAWRFCYVYRAGECRSGSSAGELYATIPQASAMNFTPCPEMEYRRVTPCAASGQANMAFVKQTNAAEHDPEGRLQRRITMAFSGPGRQAVFANARATNDGKWAIVPGYALDGLRTDMLMVKLPPFTPSDQKRRTTFQRTAIKAGAVENTTQVQVDFGYGEYGGSNDYLCTARAERCVVTSAVMDETRPFQFWHEMDRAIPCASGCTVELPALPGKVLYYRIRYLNAADATVLSMPTQALAIP